MVELALRKIVQMDHLTNLKPLPSWELLQIFVLQLHLEEQVELHTSGKCWQKIKAYMNMSSSSWSGVIICYGKDINTLLRQMNGANAVML